MSATVLVESGISAGTSFWIERPVLRVGSDPQCEICLPTAELAPHALTLEFRDGSYRAYNRGSAPVTIGAAIVQPSANGIWQPDQSVQLPGDLRLVLQIDGDPRPSPRPDSHRDDGHPSDAHRAAPAAAANDDTPGAKSKKTLLQLAVIGVCMLGTAALLMMDRDGNSSAVADRPTFESIVDATIAKDQNTAARALLPRLQYAQAAVVRGHSALARERFLKLRDHLVRRNDSLAEQDAADIAQMLQYVEYQLSQLQ